MGNSPSSLLDGNTSTVIRDKAAAELRDFSPYYRKQVSVARFSQVEDELGQHKQKLAQLLRQREAPQEAKVLYEDAVFYFDDTRKWKERYVVVRANYSLECHDSLQSFVKGVPARYLLLPTGGTVLTTEEEYMAVVDKCFPDDANVKDDFGPPLTGMSDQFPVYLHLPYRRDWYFCFTQQDDQAAFLSILSDCIRHQNQDFLKRTTYEVQAFLKAVQLYRQDKGKHEAWDMLIGSDVRVMANLVMERLLPSLNKDLLPRLKAKKTDKKRVWFATVEAAYILVQEQLLQGMSELKEKCRASVRQQEVLIHSDMDQILSCRRHLEEKIRAKVSEPAEKLCSESVQPYLGPVLDELMEPISSGFQEGRQLSEHMMDQVCQDVLAGKKQDYLKKALCNMARPNLLSCYQKISSVQEKLQHLQERFGFFNITRVIHSAQIDLQQLMENAMYTFEQLLYKAMQDHPANAGSATEKAKHRVLKQYDYDSSTVRKRIFQEALVSITLPFIKKNLAPTCKTELQGLEQFIYAEYSNFIHVENVYEHILLQTLDKEVTKVVKEAASLKKYNLFTDRRDLVTQFSTVSMSSVFSPETPAMALASPLKSSFEPEPPSPLVVNGVSSKPDEREQEKEEVKVDGMVTETEAPQGNAEQKEIVPSATEENEMPAPTADEVVQTVRADAPVACEKADPSTPSKTQESNVAPETVIQEEVISVRTAIVETAAEPETPSSDAPKENVLSESPRAAERIKTDAEKAAAQTEAPAPSPDPKHQTVTTPAEATGSQPAAAGSSQEGQCERSEVKLEAPSSGETPVVTPGDASLDVKGEEAEPLSSSDPNSMDVSVGSHSPVSDVESMEEAKVTQSSGEEVPAASDAFEAHTRKSPVSSDDNSTSAELCPQAQVEARGPDAGASVKMEAAGPTAAVSAEPVGEETPSSTGARPPDCIRQIRDLVVEVIEVEEPVQRYPTGVPTEE
ncbi:protein Niban 1 [Mastacembelus armatus]|uniref:protein Niban 1 n=1 Tax=Mastacembelus armatus TaxID=205130 RepID=UPI000E4567A3|nr:protein Niban 1 [Mastacembelus armatus]